jgi:hypothetical protein
MSFAEQAMHVLATTTTTLSCSRAAYLVDPYRAIDRQDDAITAIHFSDGSVMCTRGRGPNHQRWITSLVGGMPARDDPHLGER